MTEHDRKPVTDYPLVEKLCDAFERVDDGNPIDLQLWQGGPHVMKLEGEWEAEPLEQALRALIVEPAVEASHVVTVEWGTAQYGLLHAASPENVGISWEGAVGLCDRRDALSTPIRRQVLTLGDGRRFYSEWVRVPTQKQLRENPKWPSEVALA